MSLEKKLAKLFRLNDQNWLRHANPISVYTRYTVLPSLALPVYFRANLGDLWIALLFLSIAWTFINPIIFKKPKSTKNWASRAVLGERIFAKRKELQIPSHLVSPIYFITNFFAFLGFVLTFIAAYKGQFILMSISIILSSLAKSWFLDRMVWLYIECKSLDEEFSKWDY